MMADPNFVVPPAYVMLSILRDGESTLNRLMMVLLSQLTFFAHRPSTLPFARLLDKANKEATIIESYMFDTERKLHIAPEEHRRPTPPAAQFRITQEGKDIGQLAYFKWQDGGYLLGRGAPPVQLILSAALPSENNIEVFPVGDALYSSIVRLSEAEFRGWSDKLPKVPAFSKLSFVPIANDEARG
jgi:hypothetical protein